MQFSRQKHYYGKIKFGNSGSGCTERINNWTHTVILDHYENTPI